VEREFRVVTRELGRGLDALEAALRGEGLPEATVLELRLVAEEVLTNVAKYGHDDDTEHWARVRLTLVPGEVMLEFTDDGRAFDPLAARPPALGAPAERSLGGLGLHLIRSLVDAAEYARLGSANVLTLKKRLGGSDVDVP
jgi:anti-sigma regulatory factor (Ser/Thr protein kinase)